MANSSNDRPGRSLIDYLPITMFGAAMGLAFWMGVELTNIRARLTAIEKDLALARTSRWTRQEMYTWTETFKLANPDLHVPDLPPPLIPQD